MNKKEFIETLIDMGGCGAKPETWSRGWDDAISEVLGIAEELDEPENLSQEWIDKNKVARINNLRKMTTSDVVSVEKLKSLLVPKQDKPIIPQFVADWIDAYNLHGNNPLREYIDLESDFTEGWTNEEDAAVYHWINKNQYAFIDALRYGYEVEKEILWEIPIPDLKTSDGHIQYLTYDTKARTYFASRKNGRLQQTFNAKDLASIPEQYRRYAELCDFKKIEEVVK